MKRSIVSLLVALTLAWNPAWPASETEKNQKFQPPDLTYNLVVTATRVETPNREVASSVVVLTRADLEKTRKAFVLEALQELAGLSVQENGPPGSAATIMLRGANSEHTLILMDGVELNDPISPSRSFDFGHLLLAGIDRIEVILGPQSPLYGSDALGGVINIITRRGEGRSLLSVSGFGGSYGTGAGRLAFSGSPGRLNYALDASCLSTAGFSSAGAAYSGNTEKDGYSNLSLSGRLGYKLLDNLDFDIILRETLARTELDNFGGDFGDDPNSRQDYNQFFVRGQARFRLLKNRWEQRLAFSFVSHDRTYDNPVDSRHALDSEYGTYLSRQTTLDWQHTIYAHETNIITFGLEAQGEDGRSEYVSNGIWGPSQSFFPRKSADTVGFYLQDQIKLGGRFFATVGGRLDIHNQFGRAVTYRLAPAYIIEATGTKLKMTLGTGFKSPSLYQLYAPGTLWGPIGSPDLRPETSLGWDAGVEQTLFGGRISLGATYFHNDFRNLIQFDFARGYTNTGRAVAQGLEVFASARLASDVSVQAGFNHTDSRDEATGLSLLRRPQDKFTVRLSSPLPEDLNLAVSLVAVGARDDLEFVNFAAIRTQLKGYALLNAVLSREISSRGQIFLRLDNILDQKYETIYGYGTPRFSLYAGLNFSL
jgi:vitamin B12 transporter